MDDQPDAVGVRTQRAGSATGPFEDAAAAMAAADQLVGAYLSGEAQE